MGKTIAHLPFKIIHEVIGFSGGLLFKIFQKLMRHVSTLSEHIVQITKPLLPRLLLILDVSMHLGALTVNICNYLPLVGDSGLFLLDQAISDALDLCSDGVQSVVVILDPILLLLDQSCFEFVPE